MNFKTRFAILFTVFVGIILLIACVSTYLLFFESREDDYFKRVGKEGLEVHKIFVDIRQDDPSINDWLAVLHDQDTADCVTAERGFNHRLNGGCQVPIAGYAELHGDRIRLRGLVASPEGLSQVRGEVEGDRKEAEVLGIRLAEQLLSQGADQILSELYDPS